MLPQGGSRTPGAAVNSIRHRFSFCHLRNWRGFIAVLLATMHLLSGVLHGAHDIDVTSPSGGSEITMILDDAAPDHDHHSALSGHHCHGCFSLAAIQPLLSAAAAAPVAAPMPQHDRPQVGIAPETDFPPPKHLA